MNEFDRKLALAGSGSGGYASAVLAQVDKLIREMENKFFTKEEGEKLKTDLSNVSSRASAADSRSTKNTEEIEKLKALCEGLRQDQQKSAKEFAAAL